MSKVVPCNNTYTYAAVETNVWEISNMNTEKVNEITGFGPDHFDDPSRIKRSWMFKYRLKDGFEYRCGIWEYEGTKQQELLSLDKTFYFYGPKYIAEELFGKENVELAIDI